MTAYKENWKDDYSDQNDIIQMTAERNDAGQETRQTDFQTE